VELDGEGPGETTDPRAPVVVAAPRALHPGSRLAGRYELRERLGAGGGGAVWRAFDATLGEEIALKILALDGRHALERFRREVAVARRISHRNVCRVFDLGEADGLRFITMELVVGDDLRALLVRRRPDPARAFALARQILAGVGAAHAAGVMHRDLKPENVVVAGDRAVVIDFGLARPTTSGLSTTSIGAGTAAYMAPEQLRGEAVDRRSDVFACAVLVHELLTGARPFAGDTPAAVTASILRDPPRRLHPCDVAEPRRTAIERVLGRALAKAPGERHATAGELLVELAAAFERTGPRRRARRWIAAAAVAAAASAGVALRPGRARRDAPTAVPPPAIAPVAAVAPSPAPRAPAKDAVTLVISSVPEGAEVVRVRDRVRLGTTPVEHRLASAPGALDLVVRRGGYRDAHVRVSEQDASVEVVLERVAPRPRRRPPDGPAAAPGPDPLLRERL